MDNLNTAIVFFGLEMGFGFVGFFAAKILWQKVDNNRNQNQVVKISKRPIRI
jgi:hypothetical protein